MEDAKPLIAFVRAGEKKKVSAAQPRANTYLLSTARDRVADFDLPEYHADDSVLLCRTISVLPISASTPTSSAKRPGLALLDLS